MADTQISALGPTGLILAQNIRRIRDMRGMSYVRLATHLAEISRPIPVLGLRRIERFERRVDADDLVALARVFGVNIQQLLTSPACAVCGSTPPTGFTCNQCGECAQ